MMSWEKRSDEMRKDAEENSPKLTEEKLLWGGEMKTEMELHIPTPTSVPVSQALSLTVWAALLKARSSEWG